jgi:hypothetical protein
MITDDNIVCRATRSQVKVKAELKVETEELGSAIMDNGIVTMMQFD